MTFGATDTSQSITFTAANDNISDDGESVTIGFGSLLPTGVTAGTPSEATVTIIDNIVDVVAAFEHATYTVAEGAIATITVTLDKDPERMVSIPLTASGQGGATEEDDYSDFPASVSFASGDMSKTFTFTVDSDDVDDDDESLVVGFDTLPTGVTAGTIAETTVNITDDDFPEVMVSFEKGFVHGRRERRSRNPGCGRAQGHGHGVAERGPGADGNGSVDGDWPGRRH